MAGNSIKEAFSICLTNFLIAFFGNFDCFSSQDFSSSLISLVLSASRLLESGGVFSGLWVGLGLSPLSLLGKSLSLSSGD